MSYMTENSAKKYYMGVESPLDEHPEEGEDTHGDYGYSNQGLDQIINSKRGHDHHKNN